MFSAEKDRDAESFYAKTLTYLVFLGVFMGLGISALAREAVLLLDPKYQEAWKVIPLLCIAQILDGLPPALSPGLLLKRQTLLLPIAHAAGLLVSLILGAWLIWYLKLGLLGTSITFIASFLVICIVRVINSQKFLKIPWEWFRILKVFLVASVLYTLTLFLSFPSIWLSIVVKLLVCLTFPLLLWVVRFYEPAELKRFGMLFSRALQTLGLRSPSPPPPEP